MAIQKPLPNSKNIEPVFPNSLPYQLSFSILYTQERLLAHLTGRPLEDIQKETQAAWEEFQKTLPSTKPYNPFS